MNFRLALLECLLGQDQSELLSREERPNSLQTRYGIGPKLVSVIAFLDVVVVRRELVVGWEMAFDV